MNESVSVSVSVATIAGFLFTTGWGLTLWFLRRMVRDIEEALRRVEQHTLELAKLQGDSKRLELEVERMRIILDDLRGFLAKRGFRQRGEEREEDDGA